MSNIKISNLTIETHKGRILVKDFSFVLNEDDKIALIGEEGNGKSTILKVICGLDVSDYVSYTGQIETTGKIGYLSQSIENKYLDMSTLEYITNNDYDYGLLYEIFRDINIDTELLEDRIIRTLSGGEKVKIALARILYENPDILILDEPTNDLDLKTIIWLEEFIKNCDLPIIFVSHDETLLENCANGILHLEQLKRKSESLITYMGIGYKEYVEIRKFNIDRTNQIAKKEKAEFDKQLEKYRQIAQKVEHQQKSISRQDPHGGALLKKKMHAVKALGHNLEIKKENLTSKFEPEEAIDVFFDNIEINPNKVICDIHIDTLENGNKELSHNIDLKVLAKDKICIIGDNGCGKSTLIKKIYNEIKDRSDLNVGYMSQNYYEVMDYELTPIEYLLTNHSYEERSKIQSFLGALKFTTEEMSHKINELSEGQKCKILIVKMILDKCDVLLLDEPTRNLSPLSNPVIRKILDEYGGCIISISHDRKYINEVSNKIYQMNCEGFKLLQ